MLGTGALSSSMETCWPFPASISVRCPSSARLKLCAPAGAQGPGLLATSALPSSIEDQLALAIRFATRYVAFRRCSTLLFLCAPAGAQGLGLLATSALASSIEDLLAVTVAGLAGYVSVLNLPLKRADIKAKVARTATNFAAGLDARMASELGASLDGCVEQVRGRWHLFPTFWVVGSGCNLFSSW